MTRGPYQILLDICRSLGFGSVADTEYVLWKKILLSEGGNYSPEMSKNDILRELLRVRGGDSSNAPELILLRRLVDNVGGSWEPSYTKPRLLEIIGFNGFSVWEEFLVDDTLSFFENFITSDGKIFNSKVP
jgi:hypothetical protein